MSHIFETPEAIIDRVKKDDSSWENVAKNIAKELSELQKEKANKLDLYDDINENLTSLVEKIKK